jgi:lysophospholipase L1-like esterase
MSTPDERPKRRPRTRLFRFFTLLFTLSWVFVILEIGQRFADNRRGLYDMTELTRWAREESLYKKSEDPVLLYERRPNHTSEGRKYTVDSGILRTEAVTREKPPGTFRVVVMGDSIAAALALDPEKNFAQLLEDRLPASPAVGGKKVEVLNFGMDGYRTAQEARLLEREAASYAPDFILVQYCLNDPGNSYTPTIFFVDPPKGPRSYFLEMLFRRLNLFGHDARDSEFVPVIGPDQEDAGYWYRLYEPDSKSWRSVTAGFDSISAQAKKLGAPALLVIFPLFLPSGWRNPDVEKYHQQVAGAAKKAGLETLDLLPVYEKHTVEEMREKADDIFHPGLPGHDVAAVAILQEMERILSAKK